MKSGCMILDDVPADGKVRRRCGFEGKHGYQGMASFQQGMFFGTMIPSPCQWGQQSAPQMPSPLSSLHQATKKTHTAMNSSSQNFDMPY